MTKKDQILSSFLQHDMLKVKYALKDEETSLFLRDALNSPRPIIKAIALIVDNLEAPSPATDSTLRNIITQYLNEKAI